jgi:ankyrin repeat protein
MLIVPAMAWGMSLDEMRADLLASGYEINAVGLVNAAKAGDSGVVVSFITLGMDVNAPALDTLPLVAASGSGQTVAVKALLNAGAHVMAADHDGRTALHAAALGNYAEVARVLIKAGAALNAQDNDGYTPLMHAGEHGALEAVELLLEAGADKTFRDARDRTAFDITDEACHHGVAALLR